ncbi:MAG: hypothetical protein RL062_56, partial [Bacteroidota bacterium]
IVLLLSIGSCTFQEAPCDCDNRAAKIRAFSILPPPQIPADNPLTFCGIELGRKLFYDTRLSEDGQTSCGSCHQLSMAFTDGQSVAKGAHQKTGPRNSPTLFNLAWSPYFMMEGGVKSIEMQSLAPLLSDHEMMGSPHSLPDAVLQDPCYATMSQTVFHRPMDYYVIVRALAQFQRSLVSLDSHFDRVIYHKTELFTPAEQRGWAIFTSPKAQCSTCHVPPLFTDFQFYDIGLKDTLDLGKERESYHRHDRYKLKTPTLRNIELTPPYFHNGSVDHLEEVIEMYNLGMESERLGKSKKIQPLHWTAQEKNDLLAFLMTLTDWNAVQNERWLPLSE